VANFTGCKWVRILLPFLVKELEGMEKRGSKRKWEGVKFMFIMEWKGREAGQLHSLKKVNGLLLLHQLRGQTNCWGVLGGGQIQLN